MSCCECEFLKSWCQDERVPIEHEPDTGGYLLTLTTDRVVKMLYCGWCGEDLSDGPSPDIQSVEECGHIKALAAVPGSCIKFQEAYGDYGISGATGMLVRLLYCPICGKEQPEHGEESCVISESEVANLRERLSEFKTIEEVIERVGTPDDVAEPGSDHFYWGGEKVVISSGRSLFYYHLATTVDVVVSEEPDGELRLSFSAKKADK